MCDNTSVRVRGALIVAVVLLGACHKSTAPDAPAASSASAPRAVSDKQLFERWEDAMQRQVEADARAGATKKFASRADARRFLVSLSPVGFRPRAEYFAAFATDAGDLSAVGKRVAAYAEAHPDEAERRARAFIAHLKPLFAQVMANLHKQFPARWMRNPELALRAAKQRGRRALLVFCAKWAASCKRLENNLDDPSVQHVLAERFVAARVDMTDATSAATKHYTQQYKVHGLPLLVVFDKTGRELARKSGVLDPEGLLALLARAN